MRQKQLREAARRKKGLIRSALVSRSQKGDLFSRQLVQLPKHNPGHTMKRGTCGAMAPAPRNAQGFNSSPPARQRLDRTTDGHPLREKSKPAPAAAHTGAAQGLSCGRPSHEKIAHEKHPYNKVRHDAVPSAAEPSRRLRTSSERAAAVAELPILHLSGCGTWREKTPTAEAAEKFTPEQLPRGAAETLGCHPQFTHTSPGTMPQSQAGLDHSPAQLAGEGARCQARRPQISPNSPIELPPPLRLQTGIQVRGQSKGGVDPAPHSALGAAHAGALVHAFLCPGALRAQCQDGAHLAPQVAGKAPTCRAQAAARLVNSAVQAGNRQRMESVRARGRGRPRVLLGAAAKPPRTVRGKRRDAVAVKPVQALDTREVDGTAARGLALLNRCRPRDPYR